MSKFTLVFLLLCARIPCGAQTLQEELQRAAIPHGSFSTDELSQTVNAASAHNGDLTYLVYMRVGADQLLNGSPEIVRFDSISGAVLRKELNTQGNADCCGSPLEIQFTRSYVLASFHDNPSANTVLVTDTQLRLVELLYGFDLHEIAPDVVVFTQNMIHFAPEHQERKRVVDLRTGASQELYPPKGDKLRAEFARMRKEHMPSAEACMRANDPCDPNIYDEDLTFRKGAKLGQFEIIVTRTAEHDDVSKNEIQEWPIQISAYTYARGTHGWLYCEREDTAPRLVSSVAENMPAKEQESCVPHLPVVPDMSGSDGPFPGIVRVVK
jgi:hypothetical protein